MKSLNRKNILRQGGVLLALPHLPSVFGDKRTSPSPRRLVCIHQCLGWEAEHFFPKTFGKDVALSPTLIPLENHKDKLTIFKGFEHGVNGGHYAEHTFLTGVHLDDAKKYKEANISIDIKAAEHVGLKTRFGSLHLALPGGVGRYDRSSWTRASVSVPMISDIDSIFSQLFLEENPASKKLSESRLKHNTSIIDAVLKQSKNIQLKSNQEDRQKLDQFLTAIRDTEKKLHARKAWLNTPKPKAEKMETTHEDIRKLFPLYYQLISLALKTDSTRVATLQLPVTNQVYKELGIKDGYHLISHHGRDKNRLKQLHFVEKFHFKLISDFLTSLNEHEELGHNLLDQTSVLIGAGMGNGSSHSNKSLPVLVAGGGHQHKGHVDCRVQEQPRKLCDLYIHLLNKFGVDCHQFGNSQKVYNWEHV